MAYCRDYSLDTIGASKSVQAANLTCTLQHGNNNYMWNMMKHIEYNEVLRRNNAEQLCKRVDKNQ